MALLFVLPPAIPLASGELSHPGTSRGPKRVVVVCLDGLRADAVRSAWTPCLDQLMREGASTLQAQCVVPTFTVPNHASLVTGLLPASHGFLSHEDPGHRRVPEGLFQWLREAGRTTGLYVSKWKLRFLAAPGEVNRHVVHPGSSSTPVVDRFVRDLELPASRWDFCFIHLAEPDLAGHAHGWMSQRYVNAVYAADRLVDRIMVALKAQGLWEETLLIFLSDHGGEGFEHGSASAAVLTVPWIVRGPGLPPGVPIQQQVQAQDLAPTVLAVFGLPIPPAVQGKVLWQLLAHRFYPEMSRDAGLPQVPSDHTTR